MHTPFIHSCIPTRDYGLLNVLALKILKWRGWTIVGKLPEQSKFILAVAPHTSNWDFFIAIGAMFSLSLKVKFLGKASIFKWPVKSLLTKFGGIGVDRSHSHGVVGQIVAEFKENPQFVLGIAPEGTRSNKAEWKTGFLQIAHLANVCVVPVSLDFRKKEIEFHPEVYVSENIKQELIDFKEIFTNICPKKTE
jgi:1-acyl-sn-glycerol-3-phosphate acyltransferase